MGVVPGAGETGDCDEPPSTWTVPDCPELRRAIAAIRARRALSQAEAAALLGYRTHQGVSHVERIALGKMFKLLDCELADLIDP